MIDLERRRVLELLPGGDGESLKERLRQHPGVEALTRDRWAAFAQAATEAAPQARQVADRFHLLKNLREAVERLLGRLSETVHEPLSPREQARQEQRHRRAVRYQRVRELRDQGLSMQRIPGEVGLEEKTIRRYLRLNRCPNWNPGRQRGRRQGGLTPHIKEWISGGGRSIAQLHRDLTAKGCPVCYETVRRHVARYLGRTNRRDVPLTPPAQRTPSARQLSFDCIRRPPDWDAEGQRRLDRLRAADGTLREGLDLAVQNGGRNGLHAAIQLLCAVQRIHNIEDAFPRAVALFGLKKVIGQEGSSERESKGGRAERGQL